MFTAIVIMNMKYDKINCEEIRTISLLITLEIIFDVA